MLSIAIIAAGFLVTSVSAHGFLGDMIPSFASIQGKYGGEPVNFAGVPQEFCKGWQKGAGKNRAKKLKTGANRFNLGKPLAAHGGGSMQVSLSFDEGRTFKVIKSFIGNFPRAANAMSNDAVGDQVYNFNIPDNTKAGYAIFSWSWNNHQGLPEWYQDCSPVEIEGSGTSTLDDRPNIFVSNVPAINNCKTGGGVSVLYPDPGPDVEDKRDGRPTELPKNGNCGAVKTSTTQPTKTTSAATPKPADDDDDDDDRSGNSSGKSTTYTVKSGDDCNKIASSTGVSFADLRKKNPSINEGCTNLEPNQVLNLRKRSRIMLFY